MESLVIDQIALVDTLIQEAISMVNAGILLKNVKKSFLNRGLSEELSSKITRIAELKFDKENGIKCK